MYKITVMGKKIYAQKINENFFSNHQNTDDILELVETGSIVMFVDELSELEQIGIDEQDITIIS